MMENKPETTTGFGVNQLFKPTPLWAKTVFRVFAICTTAVSIWAASTAFLPQGVKIEILLDLKCLDMVILGLSKLFGENAAPTETKPDEQQ